MLVAAGLVKRYGTTAALDGFNLDVGAGEIVGLIGHNGAGKTTFVEIVTGLVRPDSGLVRIGGVNALRDPRAPPRLNRVPPQETAPSPHAPPPPNPPFFRPPPPPPPR